ncbi:MAG TPA: DUF72 domain-containing protein [Candidatus Binataceae bacterium]|jgi:uncharacterized protein YecE (DUF72 family)|nr:DUF72 domain-containing protein [Candidatus Binataceae bacterium]
MAARVRIGASGFSYKEWLGGFYPAKLPGARMLAFYAERLPTVEINYTFRAMPRRAMLERWAEQTPADFRFALKAPQRITHIARLRDAADSLGYFADTVTALGERLGPTLFQLPPDLKRDDGLLRDFLAVVGGRLRPAFEFRNRSWFADSVLEVLADAGAALCIAESDRLKSPIECTAPFVYARLRMESYDDAALKQWAERLGRMRAEVDEIYVYFKHEAAAPALAARLTGMLTDGA